MAKEKEYLGLQADLYRGFLRETINIMRQEVSSRLEQDPTLPPPLPSPLYN